MYKILWTLVLVLSSAMAELKQVWATPQFVNQKIKIIDIRTPSEWKETGMIPGAYPIMFYDEKGNFDVRLFLQKLNSVVKKDEQFALICRVGSRTGVVSQFLSDRFGYKVINLKGGMMKMMKEGLKTVPYRR